MTLKGFIDRPVLSSVISILIVIAGIIGLVSLPVEQYPDIAPPTVMVRATYPGASAETIQNSVIMPLEEAINGVENMMYIKSDASNNGSASITIFFRQGTNPDMDAVNVQNRVATATGQLPTEVNQIGVTTMKRQTSMLEVFMLESPDGSYDQKFLDNYMDINIEPQISRIQGVGEFFALGAKYSIRVWLKPDIMAQYQLVPDDITAALAEQNVEAATGAMGENSDNTFQYTMKYTGRLTTPEQYKNIVIRALPDGNILRLGDVADVELGEESYSFAGTTHGHPASTGIVFQTAGTNATQVVKDIDALLANISQDLPEGVVITNLMSVNDFLFGSIHEVLKTLLEAILLVIIVVYVFLQDIKSTIIPIVSVFVALIGTFAVLAVAGFSINLLTLFALVLAIGTIVDDAIIVVEAVQARFDAGYRSSRLAAVDAMSGITSAIITSTLVFMAVFIPVAMMGGTSGVFYTQFGITMAVAVALSGVNALTLSPALCALMIKPYLDENGQQKDNFAARFRKAFNAGFGAIVEKYKHGVKLFLKHRWLPWSILVVAIAALVLLMNTTKTGFVPDEDQGTIMVNVTAVPGSTLETTKKLMAEVSSRLDSIPQIRTYGSNAGYGMIAGQGVSYGMVIVRLKDWDLRPKKSDAVSAVINQIYARTADIKDASILAIAPPMIPGYGTSTGFEMYLQDLRGGDINEFYKIYQQYAMALMKRPEIQAAYSAFNTNFPQYLVQIDAAKAKQAGVSPTAILSSLAGYYGGAYVSNLNLFGKFYKVMLQADPKYRLDAQSLNDVYVRNNGGEMAPLSHFINISRVYGADVLSRFNLYNCIYIQGAAADGYSSGDAIRAIKEVAAQVLPQGYSYEFGGITREEAQTTNNTPIIFGICALIIYLLLCALYESFLVPLAVILAVPCGLMGSFLFAKMMGLENNIYLQTGLIMLIGLLAKTAILITEYATKRREAGMSLTQAAMSAAKARFRPILMTVCAMVFGLLPLMLSTGVGAHGSATLGSGVVGGLLIGTLAMLFIVPALFVAFQALQEKVKPIHFKKPEDLAEIPADELAQIGQENQEEKK